MAGHNDQFTAYLNAFVDELARAGVRHIVISPGSRSTPLALLAAHHQHITVWMNIDERSAGFFALGMAKASRAPVALLCTSGTAAANYMPAVVEASLARVPLIVLTADRPHEQRDIGAAQTINQVNLYGHHVKWFVDMPIPEPTPLLIKQAKMVAARAVATALSGPRGPVHLNFPLREPLIPNLAANYNEAEADAALQAATNESITVNRGVSVVDESVISELAAQLAAIPKGLIVCGPHDEPVFATSVVALAAQLDYPIIADPLSQLRSGEHDLSPVIDTYDAFLRDEAVATKYEPEVIIRFGAMPVSKSLQLFLTRHEHVRHIIVEEPHGWRDPVLLATDVIYAEANAFCRALSSQLDGLLASRTEARQGETILGEAKQSEAKQAKQAWLEQWQQTQKTTARVLYEASDYDALFEGRLFVELQAILPNETALFVGNSMPIRDLDAFYRADDKHIRMLANRGANGIDGLVSTALGISAAGLRTVLVIGDVSFYHDLNGLLAAKQHGLDITIIVVNNDGGGIFSFLPQAQHPQHFELLFGTPLGLDFEHVVTMYGGTFSRVSSWGDFRQAFATSMEQGGLQVIEVPTDRQSNVDMHKQIWPKVSDAISRLTEQ